MGSDHFKAYVMPLIDDVVIRLGGGTAVRPLIDQAPEQTIYFVAGGVVMLATTDEAAWSWRGPGSSAERVFTREEIRRTLDLVRLRLKTYGHVSMGGAVKTRVRRFWLQPTPSFADGAPQRENYLDDRAFDKASVAYANEWRQNYTCAGCSEVECPQCGAQGSGTRTEGRAE